jgi:hypothetical protein
MARGRIIGALAVNADDSSEMGANEPLDPMPLPTLDERANFYLRAVYGDRRFTNEEYSGARDLMLRAMANDIGARSECRLPDDVSLSLGERHEGMTAFADASLLLGGSDQPAEDSREAEPTVEHEPRVFSHRPPSLSALPRVAAICTAATLRQWPDTGPRGSPHGSPRMRARTVPL